MFAFQTEKMADVVFGDEEAELLPVPVTTSKYDFTFNLMPMDNGVTVMVEYCTSLYRETTMRRFVAGYEQILSQMLNERKQLKDISAVTDREITTLLHDFNDTAVDYPRDKCVYQLFEEQVEYTPDKIALIFENKKFTYQQLNELSNGLAVSMRKCGIQAGDKVAVLLNRNEWVVVAQLATLKLGAVFIPVDSRYPRDRIEYILTESGAKIIIKNPEPLANLVQSLYRWDLILTVPGGYS